MSLRALGHRGRWRCACDSFLNFNESPNRLRAFRSLEFMPDRTMKVYCEAGAMSDGLKRLRADHQIVIVLFPYEIRSRRADVEALPSDATWDDFADTTWDQIKSAWDDFAESDKLDRIISIIGSVNRIDALHVDSAYRWECQCFFTRDQRDILSKRVELQNVLGIRFSTLTMTGRSSSSFFMGPGLDMRNVWLCRRPAARDTLSGGAKMAQALDRATNEGLWIASMVAGWGRS